MKQTHRNKIEDLRQHLFATLEALRDETNPMPLERAREIANVSRVIVDSAKVEVEFLKATGATRSTDFLPLEEREDADDGARPRLTSAQ